MRAARRIEVCGSSFAVFLGTFTALAANEEGALVEAGLYRLELVGPIVAASEIEGNPRPCAAARG